MIIMKDDFDYSGFLLKNNKVLFLKRNFNNDQLYYIIINFTMDYIEDRTGRLLCITILVYIIVIGPTLSKDSNPTGHR